MTTIGDVRRWDPGALEAAFGSLGTHRDTLVGADDELVAARPSSWSGDAADAAGGSHDELSRALRRLAAQIAAVRSAVAEASDAVLSTRNALTEAEYLARANGFAIGDDGTVSDVAPPTSAGTVSDVAPPASAGQTDQIRHDRERVRAELRDRVEQVLRRATDIDGDLEAILRRALREEIHDDGGGSLADAALAGAAQGDLSTLGPPEGGSPGDNAGWWASLSPAEQQALLDQHPEWLGNLDGLPAEVRDQANLARIDDERARLEDEAQRLREDLDDNWFGGLFTNADVALEHVENKLAGLDRIEQTLAHGNRQLLVLDTSGEQLKAAIAVGDVDTADHVAVFTPGFSSTVHGSLEGYDSEMEQLRDIAEREQLRYGTGGSVATITWLGYEAPQPGWDLLHPDRSVASQASAERGAAALAPFLQGIDASRATDPHLTALGHSYGSTTTGLALRQDTGVDDAVFFGSPGIGASHIGDIQVPPGHSYYVEARNDWIADLGRFGIDPSHLDGIDGLSAQEATLPDGRRLTESTGHSEYLQDRSTSQYNLGVIVGGLPDRQVSGDGRGVGDVLSWPIPGTY
jgi:Alpha/beta hydrolase